MEEKTERTSGLLSREEMREKAQRDREEHERQLATIKNNGRDAEVVHRGGDGRKKRLTREEIARNEREVKKQEELNAKYEAVSKGVVQKEESVSAKRMKIKVKSEFVYPTYNDQCSVNRYNIASGYRWDRVDRSNGFEAKLALRGNRELAEAATAYRAIAEIAK
ncbi:BUD13-like protein [Aphelenchoides besseyi]|nr:BUD13-like protein [Aphelenchoides besseyi]KAI6209350.1 BUD13-like protein [Aphelenchoides besseyi]